MEVYSEVPKRVVTERLVLGIRNNVPGMDVLDFTRYCILWRSMMKIYLAGSITGLSYQEVVAAYQYKSNVLQKFGYEVLCPMTGKQKLKNEKILSAMGYEDSPISKPHAIFERDKWMVTQSDIVFADLSMSGDRVSIGTVMELAWASLLNKHTVSVIPENNVHIHAFVVEATDVLFGDVASAMTYLTKLAKGI